MKKLLTIFALLVILTAGVVRSANATTVPEGHVGIVVSFGKAENDVLKPGFHLMPPWKSVIKMDCRWQKYSVTTSAFSKDMQQVDVQMSMSYSLKQDGALRMYKTVGIDYADKIMLPRALDALKGTFAKYSAEELIANREQISYEVANTLEHQLLIYDLTVREVAIEDIDFTDVFTDAIEAKQVATQKKLQTETEQEQQTIVTKAEAERKRIQAEADAEQMKIRAEAEAEAVKIAADAEAYRLEMEAKYITDLTIQKTLAEKWDGSLPKITGNGVTPVMNVEDILGDGVE